MPHLLAFALLLLAFPALPQGMQQVLPRPGDAGEYYFYDIACSDDHNCTIPTVRYDKETKLLTLLLERTTDGGLTWSQQAAPFPDQTSHFPEWKWIGAYAIDSMRVIAFGDSTRIAITSDAGKSWIDRSISEPHVLLSASFSDSLNGMLTASGGRLYITSDGGFSWEGIDGLPKRSLFSGMMFSADDMRAFILGAGPILKTKNRWQSFDTLPHIFDWTKLGNDSLQTIGRLVWRDSNIVFGYGEIVYHYDSPSQIEAPFITRSTDGGITWTDVFKRDTYLEYIMDFSILASGHGVGVGKGRGIIRTTDWGVTWTDDSIEFNVPFLEVSDVAMLSPSMALMDFSIKNFGKIFRVALDKLAVNAVPHKMRLGTKIFPNPTFGSLSIQKWYAYNEPIRIIDLFGRTVLTTKINSEPGTSTIDCSSLPNGTYTMLIKYEGADLPVGRFVLMK